MNALIVLAHPDGQSYNASLARETQHALEQQHYNVRISDLYGRCFAADEHGRHFLRRADSARFDAQTEQRFSALNNTLPRDVQSEVEELLRADLVVLQFPLWWFGMPAILKGWMDRVFVYGKLYSSTQRMYTGVCAGKRALLSVTAASSSEACSPDGQEGDTRLILWPIHYALHYVGFTVLEPLIVTGVRGGRTGEDEKRQRALLQQHLREHRSALTNLPTRPHVAFNLPEDWDAGGKLKADAPVHSPFIGHTRWKAPAMDSSALPARRR